MLAIVYICMISPRKGKELCCGFGLKNVRDVSAVGIVFGKAYVFFLLLLFKVE